MSMYFLNQSTDQGFPIQLHPVFGFDLRDDLGDMEGTPGSPEYV
jgi:hypothetical protein